MSIKLARARKLAKIGAHPRTWCAVASRIPVDLVRSCTSRQLATIADAMYHQHAAGLIEGWLQST